MRQHYIPECYLKMFANKSDKSFYVLNKENLLKFNKVHPPKLRNPYQIASEKNFYSIDFDLTRPKSILENYDYLAIEKSFHLYEIKYPKIIKKIITGQFITRDEAFIISYSFIDFKLRNKYYRINSIEKNKEKLFDDITKDFFIDFRKGVFDKFHTTLTETENVLKKLKEDVIQNQNYSKEQHLSGLAEKKQNPESVLFKIATEILNSSWTIIKSDTINFITSDNPGYCIDDKEDAHNTKFQSGFSFIIPISSQFCLFIDNKNNTGISNFKHLNFFKGNEELVRLINRGSSYFVNKYIVSNNKSTLIQIGNQIINI